MRSCRCAEKPAAQGPGRGRDRCRHGQQREPRSSAIASRSCSRGRRRSSRSSGIAGLRRGRQPGRRHAGGVRHRDGPAGARQGGVFDAISVVGDEGVAGSELRASVAAVLPEGAEAVTSTTVADEASQRAPGGSRILPDRAAGVRVRRALRGVVHHLQHVLDHRRAAHRGARPAAGARGLRGDRSWSRSWSRRSWSGWSPRGWASSPASASRSGSRGCWARSTSTCRARRSSCCRARSSSSVVVGVVVTVVASVVPARTRARWRRSRRCARPPTRRRRRALVGRRLAVAVAVTALGVAPSLYGLFGAETNGASDRGRGRRGSRSSASRCSPRWPPGRSRAPWAPRSSGCRSRAGSGARTRCGARGGRRRRRPR